MREWWKRRSKAERLAISFLLTPTFVVFAVAGLFFAPAKIIEDFIDALCEGGG